MGNISISVLMPVYDGDKFDYLKLALESIFAQTLLPNQLVIVVDGPVSQEVGDYINLLDQHYDFIDVVKCSKNLGLPMALNRGLHYVNSEWIARFDADDLMVPNRLELQKHFIERNEVDILGGQIREFDETGNWRERLVPSEMHSILKMLPWRNPMNHVTVMYKTSLIRQYEYRNIPGYEDYDLWYRLCKNPDIKFVNMKNTLVDVRGGSQMYARRVGLRYAMGEFYFRWLSASFSHSIIKHWFAGVVRAVLALIPKRFKSLLYENFLRNRVN